MEKIRLLYVGDYSNTGFGTVAKGLLRGLSKTGKYNILQVGVNYHKDNPFDEPWSIVPASSWKVNRAEDTMYAPDPYGYKWIESRYLDEFDPDIVFINNDYAVAKRYMVNKRNQPTKLAKHRATKVLYSPVDSEPVPRVFAEIAQLFDLNIAYTAWQRQMLAEHDPIFAFMPVLYHGYNADAMHPMDKGEARSKLYDIFAKYNDGVNPEDLRRVLEKAYLIYFVGANQFRKDIPCLFRAVALLQEEVPNAYLIPQTNAVPTGNNGWILPNLQALTGLKNSVFMKHANIYTEEEINIFYNAADVLAYPTRGEGFGLPSLEAMAVKTPVVATRFGPQEELHRDGRGYFIDIRDVVAGDIFAWSYFVLPDHRSLYRQLKFVYDNPEDAKETAERAYEWAKGLTWDNQALELDSILSKLPSGIDRTESDDSQPSDSTS
jgi:glycosyltransferase involved in cell wall biosynthesis